MADQVTNYQCPNCLGALRFDGGQNMMVCESCDTTFEIAVIEQMFADKEQAAADAGTEPRWDISLSNNFSAEEAADLRAYTCPSCAAEIICDSTTAATSCPYCDNPTVVPGQFSADLRPDYVVPFKLDKKAATAALQAYYKGKKFLPKSFSAGNHIQDIKGVYVPFWLFDGETSASMRFSATREKTYKSGDYEITETDHYRVVREGTVVFEKVPVDASSKMPDEHMDSIEPYDFGELKPFSTAYLPGFMADKYDEDAEKCSERANKRIVASTEDAFRRTVADYATVTREHSNIDLKSGEVKYALLPVWMLSTKWDGKDYLFAMNGQTGKLIGDLPIDKVKFFGWLFGLTVPIAIVLSMILSAL